MTPDEWALARPSLLVTRRTIADKRRMTVRAPGGSREVDVPAPLRRMAVDQRRAGAGRRRPRAAPRGRARLPGRPRAGLDRRRPSSPAVPTDHDPCPGGSMTPQTTSSPTAPFALAAGRRGAVLAARRDALPRPARADGGRDARAHAIGQGFGYGARAYDAPIERVADPHDRGLPVPVDGPDDRDARRRWPHRARSPRPPSAPRSAVSTRCGATRCCRRSARTSASGTPSTSRAPRAPRSPPTSPRRG